MYDPARDIFTCSDDAPPEPPAPAGSSHGRLSTSDVTEMPEKTKHGHIEQAVEVAGPAQVRSASGCHLLN